MADKAEKRELLSSYQAKRRTDGTTEPFGGALPAASGGPLRFVIHHHAARNTHFDLRLEMEGVLRSWAVPKGPSPNVADKRFAALVEDHPLEYGDFEGKIPDGNYGAGWSIVWDRGIWRPTGDPIEGLHDGKLLFELDGQKLHGKWTLVRMKSGEKDWLFIKEYDDQASEAGTDDYPMNSVFSGLSIDDLEAGYNPAQDILKRLGKARVPLARIEQPKPMLARSGDPFDRKGWIFEIKYDGYRLLCEKNGDDVTLHSRNGNDLSATFPEITQAVARLPYESIIIDGEAVVHDLSGMPSFARMQQRGRLNKPSAIERAMREHPAVLYAFDCIGFMGHDLRGMPLTARKDVLVAALPQVGMIRYSSHLEKVGRAMHAATARMGLEGIVGKKANSKYIEGRSDHWVKMRVDHTDDFVVMGYRQTDGGDIRSLIVGQYIGGELVYSGSVGSGLTEARIKQYRSAFAEADEIEAPAGAPAMKDLRYFDTELVAEVRYKEITPAGQLRHPVYLRWRDDKPPEECVRDTFNRELEEVLVEEEPIDRTVHITNRDKVFWPDEGYTKGDLIDYYEAVAPWLLPWLEDRPLVLTRYPDGIDGKSFYQKDAPGFTPDWIRVEKMWSDTTEREISYFVADCVESLVYLANMGTIPLHIYHSRTHTIEQPDWCVLDLDPKEAPFRDVLAVARAIHELCEEIELPNFVKTSGSTGLHILLPLANQFTFEQSRILGELLGRVIVTRLPNICTITRNPSKRDGKVYIDYLQNGSGKLIAGTYCVRPRAGAPVSMPITWDEVNGRLKPDKFTIRNALRRLKKWDEDPAIGVLDADVDLLGALERLTTVFAASQS